MSWSKGPRCALSMNTQTSLLTINRMIFHLGDVVADIVNQRETEILGADIESFHESLFSLAHNHLSIGPSIVRRRSHRRKIVLTLR